MWSVTAQGRTGRLRGSRVAACDGSLVYVNIERVTAFGDAAVRPVLAVQRPSSPNARDLIVEGRSTTRCPPSGSREADARRLSQTAMSGRSDARLFDQSGVAEQHGLRDRETKGLGGLEVDHQLILVRSIDRQVGGTGAAEYPIDVLDTAYD